MFHALPSATALDQQTAQAQLDDLSTRPIALFDTCMVHLELSQRIEVQFYALQALHGLIQSGGYAALDDVRKQALKGRCCKEGRFRRIRRNLRRRCSCGTSWRR